MEGSRPTAVQAEYFDLKPAKICRLYIAKKGKKTPCREVVGGGTKIASDGNKRWRLKSSMNGWLAAVFIRTTTTYVRTYVRCVLRALERSAHGSHVRHLRYDVLRFWVLFPPPWPGRSRIRRMLRCRVRRHLIGSRSPLYPHPPALPLPLVLWRYMDVVTKNKGLNEARQLIKTKGETPLASVCLLSTKSARGREELTETVFTSCIYLFLLQNSISTLSTHTS